MSKRAESLMETIIAVTVIALGMTGAGLIVRTSMFGNELTQDRMAALNFAREGIEAARGIRDTNWLRYNGDDWNALPGTDEFITDGYYALKLNKETLEYYLESGSDEISDEDYRIYECSIEHPVSGATGAIYGNFDNNDSCVETDYFRNIYFEYTNADSLTATVTVGWTTGGEAKTVSRTEIINNY